MPNVKQAASEFLAKKRIAVTGVSRNPKSHGSNIVYQRLRQRGYEVFAVNPNADSVEGDRCYHDLGSIPGGVDAVVIGTRPELAEATMRECADLGIKHVWMHRGPGAGSVSKAAAEYGRQHDIRVIDGGCPLMFDPGLGGSEVEWRYLDLVRAVRQTIGIPLAVKLSPYFSSVANMARQLVEAGADGLVLFNRFYQPDLDLETLEVTPRLVLSTSDELRLPLRWIAILAGQVPASLAASSGVHTAEDAVKALLAGADVVMMTSALLRHGPEYLAGVETGLRQWLAGHGHESVGQLRGKLSQRSIRDPAAWERANYITMLATYPDQVRTEAR